MKSWIVFGLSVLIFGVDPQESQSKDFQLEEELQSRAEFFSSRDRRLVFRLFAELGIDRLRSQQSGKSDAAYSVDLVVGSDGAIQEFSVNRLNESSIFQVDRDSERLRFLRIRDASSVFRDMGLVSEAIETSSDFALRYMTEVEDPKIREFNERILRAIRLLEPTEAVAKRGEMKKDSAPTQESSIDRVEFLQDLDAEVAADSESPKIPMTQTASDENSEEPRL